ncbi:hypothetical protein ABZ154_09065 [Streptomyces sp. NPDC006261]|uniref:hypothetical protein n=1 Tax=Streptomyces sp. NPDC006261 TaxID=3156739 RepID=UPI0033B86313
MASKWVVCNSIAEKDDDADPKYPWYPYLFDSGGVSLGQFDTYFQTEEECRDFINTYILGATLEEL